ncbi:alpha/beta hydrolase [Candidatus Saccharibacteria bacterium]|nr:alpha/beta hydrolase [Candidatus Saccharibacteria bacterium]NCU40481.1 alpha/beta hydrolase [Candidatus Saccharibacteria bacterium]
MNQENFTNEYDTWIATGLLRYVEISGTKTAVRVFLNDKPKTYLFVHGVGGDFHGLVPLAYSLKDSVNIVFVDLPCHGSSDFLTDTTLGDMLTWSESLLPNLGAVGILVDGVIAHSFGCAVITQMDAEKKWYLNPPIKTFTSAKRYAAFIYRFRYVFMWVYELYPFAVWRGKIMLRHKNIKSRSIVKWVTRCTKISHKQYLAHVALVHEFISNYQLQIPKQKFVGIISSDHDTMASSGKSDRLYDEFVSIDAGHLSCFEAPEKIAELIRKTI